MVCFVHISDTHLGYRTGTALSPNGINQRAEDFSNAWLDACRQIAEIQPDFVIHSGDVFHVPKPTYRAVKDFIEGARLFAPIPLVIIAGNHETSRLRAETSVIDLVAASLEHVIATAGFAERVVSVAGQQITCVPWGRLVENRELKLDGEGILVSHGDTPVVAFATLETGKGAVLQGILDQPWDYIAMGHIHQAQCAWRENAWYAGSTERCGWSDVDASPGFYIVELPGPKITKRKVTHREFIDLGTIEDNDAAQAVLEVSHRVDGRNPLAVMRVHAARLSGSQKWIFERTCRNTLGLKHFTASYAADQRVEKTLPVEIKMGSPEQMFRDFVDGRDLEVTFKARFLEKGIAALEKAALMDVTELSAS